MTRMEEREICTVSGRFPDIPRELAGIGLVQNLNSDMKA